MMRERIVTGVRITVKALKVVVKVIIPSKILNPLFLVY